MCPPLFRTEVLQTFFASGKKDQLMALKITKSKIFLPFHILYLAKSQAFINLKPDKRTPF